MSETTRETDDAPRPRRTPDRSSDDREGTTPSSSGPTPLLGIVGPTASGKEGLSLRIAAHIGAEIISLDSMKIYRGMDIGTAKASPEQQALVRHHAIDLVDPRDSFSVKNYLDEVERRLPEIRARGRVPQLSGGTALYLKALLYGLSGPGSDPAIRDRLRAEAASTPPQSMHDRLRAVDPAAAERIHVNDTRRVTRALEVFEMTGQPISSFQNDFDRDEPRRHAVLVGLRREREDLHRRIDDRIDRMLAAGWIDEVRRILDQGGFGKESSQALGYREIVEHLEGRFSAREARDRIAFATHRFARHQMTWLRRFSMIRWVDVEPDATVDSLLERALESLADTLPAR